MAKNFEKYLWLELLGFDNESADYAVGDLLGGMDVKPDMVSLLIWYTDLIHTHTDLTADAPLGLKHCSYYGKRYNEERNRQNWTKFQLKGLVDKLHEYGVKVYISVFDQVLDRDFALRQGIPAQPEWLDGHSEVLYTLRDGSRAQSICPWKRLGDGRFYEDFFFAQLKKFLVDYGFDGFHAADGYAHPRFALCDGDFSDDMLAQFSDFRKRVLPPELKTTPEKSAFILKNLRSDWIAFHVARHAAFWRKGVEMLKTISRGIVFHNAWTRDPLEAIWRYGVDYREIARAGVRTFIIEAQAPVVELEGWNHSPAPMLDIYRSALLRISAALPGCKLILLHCVKDSTEQYSALRHAPTRLESELYSLLNAMNAKSRALGGVIVCLADAIRKDEWRRLDSFYQFAFSGIPAGFFSAPVLWSDAALAREYQNYAGTSQCSSQRLHYMLLAGGAVVTRIARDGSERGPWGIVLNPVFRSAAELNDLRRDFAGLVLIGWAGGSDFICRIERGGRPLREIRAATVEKQPWPEPSSWLDELPEVMPDAAFFTAAATLVNEFTTSISSKDPAAAAAVRSWGFFQGNGVLRLFLENEKSTYHTVCQRLRGNYESVKILTDYPSLPVELVHEIEGEQAVTWFSAKIPPNGAIVLDLTPDGGPGRGQ